MSQPVPPDATPQYQPYQAPMNMVHDPSTGWWAPKGQTPDGRRLADVGRRFGGMLLDSLVQSIPILVVVAIIFIAIVGSISETSGSDEEVSGAAVGLIVLLYGALFVFSIGVYVLQAEMLFRRGATLGMGWLGLRCIDGRTGGPISRGKAYGRTLFAAFISGQVAGIGYWWAFFDDRNRALHDIVAGTVVVDAR